MKRRAVALTLAVGVLAGCTSIGVGLSIPIGGIGGVSIGVGSDGRVNGGVSVGTGGVSVGVGGTAQLPPPEPAVRSRTTAPPASAASAAESAASAASSPRT